jgi:alpha,alpha-trehalase
MQKDKDRELRIHELPSALERMDEIAGRVRGRRPAVFLDYDGTLTPIVERPEDAGLSEEMRRIVRELAQRCTVAVVSGRDLKDVRERVAVEGILYAGSHGFDIEGPRGMGLRNEKGREFLAVLDQAETMLRKEVDPVPEAWVERKRFSIAVHFRKVDGPRVGEVEEAVHRVAGSLPGLRTSEGKKIFELKPAIDWDKGKAVLWLLETLHLSSDVLPVYLGDDTTDEDGFRAIRDFGIAIVVGEENRETLAHYRLRGTEEVRVFLARLAYIQTS